MRMFDAVDSTLVRKLVGMCEEMPADRCTQKR